jgi:hypothetical protein
MQEGAQAPSHNFHQGGVPVLLKCGVDEQGNPWAVLVQLQNCKGERMGGWVVVCDKLCWHVLGWGMGVYQGGVLRESFQGGAAPSA